MKLPIQLPFKKKDNKEYFLSLLLNDEHIHATIFAQSNGKIEIIGEKQHHLTSPLETLPEESLLDILDKTISAAETSIADNFGNRKTIFGVKETWIEESKIKKEYLQKLKKLCDALGLTPIGFLVNHEAIAHLLQQQEGAPISAILVEMGVHELAISILRAGKLLETRRVPTGDSAVQTIDKTLLHFTSYEILPSRIIVANASHHEKLSQELITHQWSKSIPFLHVPQIKILPNTYEGKSLLFGAATQMGFEVVDKFDAPTIPDEGENFSLIADNTQEEIKEEKTPTEEKPSEETFGFVAEKDIADQKQEIPTNNTSDETDVDEQEASETTQQNEEIKQFNQEFFEAEHETNEKPTHHKKSAFQQKIIHTAHTSMNKIKGFFTAIPLPSVVSNVPLLQNNKWLLIIPPILLGIVILLFLGYMYGVKATVILQIDPKTIEKTQAITFSTKQSTDASRNILQAETVSVSENGSAQTNTTGKKEIGDKAKGTVTVLSSLPKSQTISAGTTLTSANGLIFTLDKDVSLASSSGVSDIKSAQSGVTAKDIGKESNLPSGTTFSIAGFDKSSIQGKNDNAFSGGSKQEITIVAKADIAKITDSLPKQLQGKAKGDLAAKLDGSKELLPIILTTSFDKKTYDKNVGDEASTVTLQGSVSFDSAAYAKSEVASYALDMLSKENDSLSPDKSSVSYTISDIEESNGDIGAKISIKGFLLPKIDKASVAKDITGKSFSQVQEMVKKLPQVKSADISLSPNLPFLPASLPQMTDNITVKVEINE